MLKSYTLGVADPLIVLLLTFALLLSCLVALAPVSAWKGRQQCKIGIIVCGNGRQV